MKRDVLEEQYEVEHIVNRRRVGQEYQYQVKWKGWSSKDNTWEPLQHLVNVLDLVKQFQASLQRNSRKKLMPSIQPSQNSFSRKKIKVQKESFQPVLFKQKNNLKKGLEETPARPAKREKQKSIEQTPLSMQIQKQQPAKPKKQKFQRKITKIQKSDQKFKQRKEKAFFSGKQSKPIIQVQQTNEFPKIKKIYSVVLSEEGQNYYEVGFHATGDRQFLPTMLNQAFIEENSPDALIQYYQQLYIYKKTDEQK